MKDTDQGIFAVPGYLFSAVECGIKYENRLDYSLIAAEGNCWCAGMFTTNRIAAAPVQLCRMRIHNPVRAVLINATNANACTGTEGMENAEILTADIARRLDVPEGSVLMASTGVIGRQLPREKMLACHGRLLDLRDGKNGPLVAEAIMTTDTRPKDISERFSTSRGEFTIGGIAKGSGMIAPNMATLLAFLITDAPLPRDILNKSFRSAVNRSLNAITIDGDMSTNDTALLLSPVSDNPLTDEGDIENYKASLQKILGRMARLLVSDGEGTTKTVTVEVINARDEEDARRAARAVGESLLVKTAFFGRDPNWGRIACAAGYSGAEVREENLSIYYGDIPLLLKGRPEPLDAVALADILKEESFTVTVDLGAGTARFSLLTSDISYDYVKINAEYTT